MHQFRSQVATALWLALQLSCAWSRAAAVDLVQLTFDEPNLRIWCTEPAWSPDGRRIAFVRGTWSETDVAFASEIAIVPASGGPLVPVAVQSDAHGKLLCTHPTWSIDGGRLAFSTQRGVCVVDLTLGSRRMLAVDHGGQLHPAWSQDGRHIAFQSDQRGIYDIWVIDPNTADGTAATPVTTVNAMERAPAWSPDGAWIAFESNRDGNLDIWIAPVDGGYPRRITSSPSDDSHPTWSPDGRLIAFTSRRSGNADLWVIPASGGSATQLTTDRSEDFDPSWSPEGGRIAFASTRAGGTHIWVASNLPPADLLLRNWKLHGERLR